MTSPWQGEPDRDALDSALMILRREPVKAVQEFERLAELGSLLSMNYLGAIYCRGDAIPKDIERGIYWYKRGAAGGLVKAEYYLALEYMLQKRYDEAITLYYGASGVGYSPATNALAKAYFSGIGVDRDAKVALKYWREAISQGHLLAKRDMAIGMISGTFGAINMFRGIAVYCITVVEIVVEIIRDRNSKKII